MGTKEKGKVYNNGQKDANIKTPPNKNNKRSTGGRETKDQSTGKKIRPENAQQDERHDPTKE